MRESDYETKKSSYKFIESFFVQDELFLDIKTNPRNVTGRKSIVLSFIIRASESTLFEIHVNLDAFISTSRITRIKQQQEEYYITPGILTWLQKARLRFSSHSGLS